MKFIKSDLLLTFYKFYMILYLIPLEKIGYGNYNVYWLSSIIPSIPNFSDFKLAKKQRFKRKPNNHNSPDFQKTQKEKKTERKKIIS